MNENEIRQELQASLEGRLEGLVDEINRFNAIRV